MSKPKKQKALPLPMAMPVQALIPQTAAVPVAQPGGISDGDLADLISQRVIQTLDEELKDAQKVLENTKTRVEEAYQEEVAKLAKKMGLDLLQSNKGNDFFNQTDISSDCVVLQRPYGKIRKHVFLIARAGSDKCIGVLVEPLDFDGHEEIEEARLLQKAAEDRLTKAKNDRTHFKTAVLERRLASTTEGHFILTQIENMTEEMLKQFRKS